MAQSFFEMSNISDSDVWFKDVYFSVSNYCGPNYNPLVGSVIGSIIVGLSGIVPLFIIPIDGGVHFGKGGRFHNYKFTIRINSLSRCSTYTLLFEDFYV